MLAQLIRHLRRGRELGFPTDNLEAFEKVIRCMKEIGIGDIKDDRMTRAIGIVVEGYQLARAPTPAEVFSREFLPPRAERELVYTAN